MSATLREMARDLDGEVTRKDAKEIARLHGYTWKALRKAIKRKRQKAR